MTMKLFASVGAAVAALAFATATQAGITIDGTRDAAYGAPTAMILNAPAGSPTTSFDFQHPGVTTSGEGYSIYLTSDADNVYGYIQGDGIGTSAGNFTNLYFDLNPPVGDGTDIGFEVTNKRAFVAGGPAGEYATIGIEYANGPHDSIEFSIPNSAFEAPIAGLTYFPGQTFASAGSTVNLGLSQTLSYSVEGRDLGSVVIGGSAVSAAPEPSAWALLLAGVGAMGLMLRRRRSVLANA